MASTVQVDPPLHHRRLLLLLPTSASIAVLCSVLLLSLVLLFRLHSPRRSSTGKPAPRLPPSPPRLPIIGNLHQLGRLPHRSLRALARKHGPLMFLQLGQVPTLVVSSAKAAEEVLKAHDLAFAGRPCSGALAAVTRCQGIGSAPYGEYWRQARKICVVHLLSSRRVQEFRAIREEHVAGLVGKISELSSSADVVDVGKALSSFTNSLICRATVGASAVEEATTTRDITELVARTSALVGGFQVEHFFPSLAWLGKLTGMDAKVREATGRQRAFLRTLIGAAGERAECTADHDHGGFLDVLLSLQRDDTTAGFQLSRDEVEAILMGLVNAGTDTSYLVLERALEELVKNPSAMERAQEEVRGSTAVLLRVRGKEPPDVVGEDDVSRMSYLKAVIKETLRLYPPAPLLLPRESTKAVQMQGYEIPAKTRVVVNAWAIARDPDYWESPEDFSPERFLKSSVDFKGNDLQFIPFGAGRRICPGIHFAMSTTELALANLLYHFNWSPSEEMVGAESLNADEEPGLTVHRSRSLLLAVKPNSPH